MKNILKGSVILFLLLFEVHQAHTQVFWTETFGSGCNAGVLANGFVSPNGTWIVDAPLVSNGADANLWYISAAENGEGVGNCGAGCGTHPTLHIGTQSGDTGAEYISITGAETNAKAISPIIDCTGKCSVEMSFEYIENGDGTNDNLIVWYFDGTTWSVLEDTPKTPLGTCAPQGLWESRTIHLPSSADNNPAVQIGFQWVNDGTGSETTPSVAIYNIQMRERSNVAEIITASSSLCEVNTLLLEATPPTSGTGLWKVIAGGATLNNPSNSTTEGTNFSYGLNTFVWTVSFPSCSQSDTVTIIVDANPSKANTQNDLILCNDTSTNIVATSPSVGVGGWSDVKGTATFLDTLDPNTVLYNLSEGWNEIVWTVSNGVCPSNQDTLNVFKKNYAKIYSSDTTICLTSGSLQLEGSPIPVGVLSTWYTISGGVEFENQDSSSPILSYLNGGENKIVYSHHHPVCGTTTDTLLVIGKQCEEYNPIIPTVITPNSDGKNDLFVIRNLHTLYPNAEVKIVNRWGNVVFESIGYEEPWNGTLMNEGQELSGGTYFYRIVLNDNAKREITGPISIIR